MLETTVDTMRLQQVHIVAPKFFIPNSSEYQGMWIPEYFELQIPPFLRGTSGYYGETSDITGQSEGMH
jgi:hypothetical protein